MVLLSLTQTTPSGEVVTRIAMALPQVRTDRRKDRVESSPEQMARSSEMANAISQKLKTRLRVLGWYHSHPHITVLPSHVDVRTQVSRTSVGGGGHVMAGWLRVGDGGVVGYASALHDGRNSGG